MDNARQMCNFLFELLILSASIYVYFTTEQLGMCLQLLIKYWFYDNYVEIKNNTFYNEKS